MPKPCAQWTFETDLRDDISGEPATPVGPPATRPTLVGGRLRCPGLRDSEIQSPPLRKNLAARTLEAWVLIGNVHQRDGCVMRTEDRPTHDGILLTDVRWTNGSSLRQRSGRLEAHDEDAKPNQLVHVAAVYAADDSIAFYRNGRKYGEPLRPADEPGKLQTYRSGTGSIFLGQGFLGEIEEARVYDRPLTETEIGASYRIGPAGKK